MALVELSQLTQSRIAVLLGVPPFLVGLPSGGDSMTYSNVTALFDYHWRAGLRPKAQAVMSALSEWLLPRGVDASKSTATRTCSRSPSREPGRIRSWRRFTTRPGRPSPSRKSAAPSASKSPARPAYRP